MRGPSLLLGACSCIGRVVPSESWSALLRLDILEFKARLLACVRWAGYAQIKGRGSGYTIGGCQHRIASRGAQSRTILGNSSSLFRHDDTEASDMITSNVSVLPLTQLRTSFVKVSWIHRNLNPPTIDFLRHDEGGKPQPRLCPLGFTLELQLSEVALRTLCSSQAGPFK